MKSDCPGEGLLLEVIDVSKGYVKVKMSITAPIQQQSFSGIQNRYYQTNTH